METKEVKKTSSPKCKGCGDFAKKIQNMKNTLLLQAVRAGHVDCVTEALREGADVNASDFSLQNVPCSEINCPRNFYVRYNYMRKHLDGAFHGGPAICTAALLPREDCLEVLIKAGADVNSRSCYDHTPLMLAAHSGKLTFVDLLINAGADVNAQASVNSLGEPLPDNRGDTALILVVQNNENLECVRRLIDAGADVNKQDEYGMTALFLAIDNDEYCDDGCTQLLLKAGIDVNIRHDVGETALHWAIEERVEVIEEGDRVTLLYDATKDAHHNDSILTAIPALLKAGIVINTPPESLLSRYLQIYKGQEKKDIVLLLAAAGMSLRLKVPDICSRRRRVLNICAERQLGIIC